MSKKDFSVALKYVEARPRSQRRKGAEARVSGISVVGSGVSATDLSLLNANLISVTNNFTALKDLFDSMFEKDSEGNIHAKLSLWSSGGITAGGVGSGGSGGGGASYDRLDAWSDYSADKAGYVLSALLGKDLDNRVSALANAGYITQSALAPYALRSEIPSLVGYATQSWVESKNYLTGITSAMVTTVLGYTPYNSANFTKANIKSTLGISDWALASAKPTYTASEVGALGVKNTAADANKLNGYLPTTYMRASGQYTDSLNDLTSLGIYRMSGTITDGPTDAGGYGNLMVVRSNSWDTLSQLYFNANNNRVFVRSGVNSNFTSRGWNTIAFTSDIPTKLSQLTDDVVAGKYLLLSGGTVSGTLSVSSILRFSDTDGTYKILLQRDSSGNILFGGGFSTNNMYIDANVLRIRATESIFSRKVTAPSITANSLTIGGATITYDSVNEALCINGNMYAIGGITAGGVGSGGSGGGGISYSRLDSWADYSANKAGYVLSALLGKDLDDRVSALANAGYITASYLAPYALRSEIPSLVGYATESWVNTALAGYLPLSGGTLTDALTVKGSGSPLTVHRTQPLASVVKFVNTDGNLGWLGVDIDKTAIFMEASGVIKKLLHSGNYADYITNSYLKSTLGISDWALASAKPTYTASEVGALSVNGGTVNGNILTTGVITSNSYISGSYFRGNITNEYIDTNIDSSFRTSLDVGGISTFIKAFRIGGSGLGALKLPWSPILAWGVGDVHAFIQIAYDERAQIVVGGGNGNSIKWSNKLIHDGNYSDYALPKTGGTINGSITATSFIGGTSTISGDLKGLHNLIFADGYLGRKFSLTNGGSIFYQAPSVSGGWATNWSVKSNDGITSFGDLAGAFGVGNSFSYFYYGGEYDSPSIAIMASGMIAIGGTTANEKLHVHGNGKFEGAITANSFIGNLTGNADSASCVTGTANYANVALGENKVRLISNQTGNVGDFPKSWVSGLSVMSNYVGWQMVSYAGVDANPYFRKIADTGTWSEWKELAFLDDITGGMADYYGSRVASANVEFTDSAVRKIIATSSMTTAKPPADGSILHFAWDNAGGWNHQLFITSGGNADPDKRMAWRAQNYGSWSEWKPIAFTDSNVASATKLATPRLIWGQSFDGTQDVTGALTAPAITTNSLTIGGATITYDLVNEALCINGNMYALGGVTAGGAGISAYTSLEARVARIEQQLNIS